MGRKLNGIADDYVASRIEDARSALQQNLAKHPTPDPAAGSRMLATIAQLHYDIGVGLYQLEQPPEEIQAQLKLATEWWVTSFERRPPAGDETPSRNPTDFLRVLGLVTCFGAPDLRVRAGRIPRDRFQHPPTLFPLTADVVQLFQHVLAEGRLPQEAAARALVACEADNASRYEAQYLRALVRGLLALEARDAATLEQATRDVAAAHEREARRGELKLVFEGFLCETALALVQLGPELGLTVDPGSPYVPLDLLSP